MIVYFADRKLNILGHASTELPGGLEITDDWMGGDVETGVSLFEFKIPFDNETREDVEAFTAVGNYVLRSHDGENGFFTIIDTETDTKKQTMYVYAEDAGMDLLNEVFGKYEADKAYPISHYVEMFASGSGFVIGNNEASSLTRKLTFDTEATASARIASVADAFDGCEVSYSFDIDGLLVTRKYINIHKQRGQDIGAQLRLNYDIDSIITSKSIGNLATALRCTGGAIDQESRILEATGGGVAYKLDLVTEGRTKNTVQINATIKAELTSEDAELGEAYGLQASVYMGGSWHSVVIKATTEADKENWKGTVSHTTEFTFTVSGVPAGVATYTDIKLKVERTDGKGGSAGVLAATNCAAYSIPNYVTGGENGEEIASRDITIEGYVYDDGDFYVDGPLLKSREALKNWSRYLWKTDDTHESGGHVVKTYSYDTDSQKTLCEEAIAELKKIREVEVNYKVEITKLPPNIKLGDRVNIVDDAGGLYISARLLKFEVSAANQEHKATIGEYLIKGSGIADKVAALAQKFAKLSVSAARALAIAKNAQSAANTAKSSATTAVADARAAQNAANAAQNAADAASASALAAQEKADAAQSAVSGVEASVGGIIESVANAEAAAEQARQAAETAESKVTEAHEAAVNAQTKAEEAAAAVGTAQSTADTAIEKAEDAETAAAQAVAEAEAAANTAVAAKQDAEAAQREIDNLGESLTTLESTMSAEYARKTDLTEAEASLQTQITQNAAGIASTASKVQRIDETANNAQETLLGAFEWANLAQKQADEAQAYAEEAQAAADEAEQAAVDAQAEADTAQAAADSAQAVADKAEADLKAAKADLETVQSRADATEEEIAAAQAVVNAAQAAADKAQEDADAAIKSATAAQKVANDAVENANKALETANLAASDAAVAQMVADEAKGDATAAQKAADDAAATAAAAQNTALTARANADEAQSTADTAAADATTAQQLADDADARAQQAAQDLAAAEQALEEVMAKVDATEEEVAEAQAYVEAAQASATEAQTEADNAQVAATAARTDADTAQAAADAAKTEADEAQTAAEESQAAADAAKREVDGLAVRVMDAETRIDQNAEQIALRATKEEVTETLGGYFTKEETAAAILADSESVILSALESYTKTGDFEAYKETVTSQLEVMAGEITMKFSTTTEQIDAVDGDMQSKFTELYNYIVFSGGGITLNESTGLRLELAGGNIALYNGETQLGLWSGSDFFCGNIIVQVNERAQFGNFAWIPRSDGSLMFSKVGG